MDQLVEFESHNRKVIIQTTQKLNYLVLMSEFSNIAIEA